MGIRVLALALVSLLLSSSIVSAQAPQPVAQDAADASEPVPIATLPRAENIDLEKPIEKLPEPVVEVNNKPDTETIPDGPEASTKPAEEPLFDEGVPFVLLDTVVPPRTSTRMAWSPSQSFEGIAGSTPVLVVNGTKPGPVLCLTAAIHGDELNGIEIVRRLMYDIKPSELSGTVVGVPIVNLQGFQRNSRYLTDRRDLNRFFPGNPNGSLASRIAYSFFEEIIQHCSYLVDLHTGSFHRTNLPQLRADLLNDSVKELSKGFGSTVVLHSTGASGTLRYAANMIGVPTVTLEAGEPMRLQEKAVAHGVKAIQTLMNTLKMQKRSRFWGKPEPVFYQSTWVRADFGGILFSEVYLGKKVNPGDILGTVTDPITNRRNEIQSPVKGRILGMALNQVVMPGFAAFRIGIDSVAAVEEVFEDGAEESLDSSKVDSGTTGDYAVSDTDLEPETAE